MKTSRILAGLLGVGFAGAATAQVIDGTVDAVYGAPLAVQTVQTEFGDASDATGLGGGGELNAGYAIADLNTGKLSVLLTGNIEPNFNKVNVFIDSQPGGENVLDGGLAYDFGDVAANFGGLTFDTGFEADYHLFGRWGGGAFEVDIVDRAASTPGNEFGNFGAASAGSGTGVQTGTITAAAGTPTTGADGGTFLTSDVEFGFNNTNTAGVAGGTAAADASAAAAVATGFEFAIDLADIGNPGFGDVILIHAAYGNGDNNFHSNQILGGVPAPQGNLGGDGAGNFTGTLSGIDFNQFDGDQFFAVTVVPEPATAALVGLGGLAMLRRRK
ncbi:MAG: PEP-CTERM sorting domain-containing protein [Planctomycetota bacterium]